MWAPVEGAWGFASIETQIRERLGLAAPVDFEPLPDTEQWRRRRSTPTASTDWDNGGHKMHLPDHLTVPVTEPFDDGNQNVLDFRPGTTRAYGPGHSVLVVDDYRRWYSELTATSSASGAPVEMIVRTIGWMGIYSKSPTTTFMHRTSEEIHLWGSSPDSR